MATDATTGQVPTAYGVLMGWQMATDGQTFHTGCCWLVPTDGRPQRTASSPRGRGKIACTKYTKTLILYVIVCVELCVNYATI